MKKYIINDVEYTLEQISSAANDNGVDIDTYINDMGAQVVTDTVEDPVEKPKAVAKETVPATAETVNTDLQLENGSSDLLEANEISLEEKRQLPFGVSQHLLRNNKKFTRENIDQANLEIEEQKNKGFDEHVEDLKDAIVGNGVERFKNWSYNIFGADGIGGMAGPSTISRLQQASAAFAIAMDKISDTKESEDKAKEELKTLSDLQSMQKPMPSIVDDNSEGLLGAIAGLVGDATQVGQSVIPTTIAAIGGTAVAGPAGGVAAGVTATGLQIIPSFITDYNVTKAEEKYKDEGLSQDEAVNKLIEEDEAEMLVPLVAASIAMIPEYIGFKGINKYLMTSTAGKNVMAKVARLGLTSGKEGLTEVAQLFPEGVNSALAAGENLDDAAIEGLQYTFENAKDTFISSAAGTAAFGLGGKGVKKGGARLWRKMRNTRVAIDGGKMEALVDEISDLNVKRMEANEPELKEALSEKIKTKVQELESLDAKANSIMSFAEDSEFEKITELEDLKKVYINKVKNIQNKKEELDPKEYAESLDIYKEKYLEAQNRIKGISENIQAKAEKATPEDVSERTVKNANAINNAYAKDPSNDTFFNVVIPNTQDLVDGIVNKMFRQNPEFKESGMTKQDFKNQLTTGDVSNPASSLFGLYESFNPDKGQLLTTWLSRNLENRAKRIVDTKIGKQATVGGQSLDTQESKELAADEVEIKISSIKGPRFAKKLGLSDELVNKVRNAAKKALSTAKKVDDKKFLSDLVNTINNEIFNDIRNLIPKPKGREAFIKQFAETIWDTMPQSSMAKATRNETFKQWGIESPTKEAFVDYFLGRDQEGLGESTINDRAKKQLPQYLAKAIGAEYAQDLLENDPDTRERFGLTQKQEVEDAADEIQGKTKEERDLQNTEPEALEELRRLADEGDAGNIDKILGTERVSVDNTNAENNYEKLTKRQKAILNFVKIAKIPSILLQKAGFANFGAEYVKRNGTKYYKLKNGKEVEKGTPEFKKAQEENLILPRQDRGGLFSSTNDGFFKQAMEIAKENDKLYPGLSSKRVTIPKGARLDADFLKKNAQRMKENMDFLITSMKILTQAVHKHNLPIEDAFLFITSAYQATEGFIKVAAPFEYISKSFAYGKSGKQRIGETYREEHQPPASYIGKVMMWAIKNNKADLIEPFIRKNYYQTQLSKADDQKIDDAKLDSGMPKGYLIFENPIIRMAESGVNLNDQLNIETGQTMAQEFDAESAETPDAIAASNEVVKEKLEDNIETLIDRAIGKLEDYLGPKGALQANFAAVPINILIGGLRATKLAYKSSKSLAKALEAGYKKVQDYMSQQEWLDFAKQAVTEVKKEPTGATIALAIANENAIKNEQNRQNKIKTLKDAGVYSKSDDSKTSKELDQKLAEEDSKIKESNRTEGMERNFRKILNNKKSTGKRPSKWFIPSNAEDIKGLLYAFLPDGAAGVAAKKFFNSTILKPYSDAVAAAEAEILQLSKKFVQIKEQAKVKLDENIEGTPYTMGDAIKVYNWVKAGVEVDVLKQEYLDRMIGAVEANAEAKYLADEIAANYDIAYNKNWRGVPLNKSIFDAIQEGTRTKHLEVFSQNVDAIFNKDNLQEIENVFGKSYVQALQNSLKRMQSGRNRVSTDAQSNKFLNWINKSVATTMFFNTRSAVLQLLSSLNFIGQENNNLFKATAAFANQKQWQEDYNKLWNSDYLSNRRDGAKFDVLADEIAEDQESFLNKLLQKGFLPTRYADSFAIALGGAAFYRNRANALMKEGMSKEDAEAQALKDWQASAEETQQSSDPSKISEIQASSIGKIIYAFANTPFQYARKGKRLLQDVASGRSKAKGGMNQVRKDLQSVFYYTAGQAMLFNALQTALFASMFSDDEEDKLEEKTITAIERILTSYAKSLGNPGAVIGSIYSVLAEANEQIEKRGRIDNAYKLALEATAISPPLNTKLKDIVAIGNIYKYNHKQIEKDPFEAKLDNPVLEITGNIASFAGYPLDRVIRKAQNLEAVMNEQTEAWEKVFLTLGWSKWELGINLEDSKFNKPKFDKPKFKKPDFNKPKFKKSPTKKLERGVAGRANNDGTIEIDPNLSPVEREKTIAHEEQHMKDMKAGKLNYDDDYVYWNDGKYERKNGKIKYKGKSYIEGHKDLPWEKVAYSAEPSTAEAKKRTKLYA